MAKNRQRLHNKLLRNRHSVPLRSLERRRHRSQVIHYIFYNHNSRKRSLEFHFHYSSTRLLPHLGLSAQNIPQKPQNGHLRHKQDHHSNYFTDYWIVLLHGRTVRRRRLPQTQPCRLAHIWLRVCLLLPPSSHCQRNKSGNI
jgi:hypothetical protein